MLIIFIFFMYCTFFISLSTQMVYGYMFLSMGINWVWCIKGNIASRAFIDRNVNNAIGTVLQRRKSWWTKYHLFRWLVGEQAGRRTPAVQFEAHAKTGGLWKEERETERKRKYRRINFKLNMGNVCLRWFFELCTWSVFS